MYNEKFPDQSKKFPKTGPNFLAILKSFVLYDRKYYYLHVKKNPRHMVNYYYYYYFFWGGVLFVRKYLGL